MGHFTGKSLQEFHELCSDGMDFGEGPVYDFARCLSKKGEIYGVSTGESCKGGVPIIPKRKGKTRLEKLREAFLKKKGREMTSKELDKVRHMLQKRSKGKNND